MDYNLKSLIGIFTCFLVAFILVFSSGCIDSPSNGTHFNSGGVSFDHPSGWTFNSVQSPDIANAKKNNSSEIILQITKQELNEFNSKYGINGTTNEEIKKSYVNVMTTEYGAEIFAYKNRTIDGNQALEIYAMKPGIARTVIFFIKNDYIYYITFDYPSNQNLTEDIEMITNSFKIT